VSIIDRHAEKSAIKRDGPVFFSSSPVKVAGDENTIIAIVAPYRGETSRPADILHFHQLGPASRWSGKANLPPYPSVF
jgi:hypothetical protein